MRCRHADSVAEAALTAARAILRLPLPANAMLSAFNASKAASHLAAAVVSLCGSCTPASLVVLGADGVLAGLALVSSCLGWDTWSERPASDVHALMLLGAGGRESPGEGQLSVAAAPWAALQSTLAQPPTDHASTEGSGAGTAFGKLLEGVDAAPWWVYFPMCQHVALRLPGNPASICLS